MKFHKLLLVVFLLAEAGTAMAQTQPPPSLVAQKERVVSDSCGSGALAFQITSAILQETRPINLVLPV